MNDHDTFIDERLARIERLLNELLRRIPEPRCRICGQVEAFHPNSQQPQTANYYGESQNQMLASHFFTP